MTRPKVDPDKRQRIAQACDACKRRKQKCNGAQPCNGCSKRHATCTYSASAVSSDEQRSPKRRAINPFNGLFAASSIASTPGPRMVPTPNIRLQDPTHPQGASVTNIQQPEAQEVRTQGPVFPEPEAHLEAGGSSSGSKDEEAIVESNPRLLEDPTGRVLYIGDSAALSFLQLIRTYVESIAGTQNSFIMDPRRLKIVEHTVTLPPNIRRTHLLPDSQTAIILVNSFFINTKGLIEVFPRETFLGNLEKCYSDPLSVDPSWLCLLYLTFAIGLVMATPKPGTPDESIIQKLLGEVFIGRDGKSYPVDRAELFYLDAKHLTDPSSGFEDAGFWSIQALTLMSVYMLAVSRRNAAYAYAGMALRSAFALGLHRAETMALFSATEQLVRRNLWRSLYVLDRYLSASLGRPTAIRDSDCSGDILTSRGGTMDGCGLEAAVHSCHTIGVILDQVYSQRKVSGKLAQEIADQCKGWPQALDPTLHHSQANPANPAQGIAILHVNLFHWHSIILLTRPFFLFTMNKEEQMRRDTGQRPFREGSLTDRFGEACVSASCQSIALVHNALKGGYLPRRNPFVIYFLFSSALVVLSSEFSDLYPHITVNSPAASAIEAIKYCAETDPQGSRYHFILTAFRDLIVQHRARMAQTSDTNIQPQLTDLPQSIPLSFVTSPPLATMPAHPAPTSIFQTPQQHRAEPSMSPPEPVPSATPTSSTHIPPAEVCQDPKDGPPGLPTPRSSWDSFFELAHLPSDKTSDGGKDSLGGDAEIEFESLWQWPNHDGSGLLPTGVNLTPGGTTLMPGGALGLKLGRGSWSGV